MSLLWLVSLFKKDVSIVDIFWSLGFVFQMVLLFTYSGVLTPRATLVFFLTLLWAFRLATHIYLRGRGKGEDPRYAKMRESSGPKFQWTSLFQVFGLQGVLMWVIAAPILSIQLLPQPLDLNWLDYCGVALWSTGFLFEAIADWQLVRFKKNNSHNQSVLRSGLWSLSRHPNYFGESVLWWGFFVIALNANGGWYTFFSPLLMTILLIKVSGADLLDAHLKKRKPEYQRYIDEVPKFFPKIF